ncbi:glycosyltransferase family 4 protein [Halalkalicoccus ordinarius]|uniref:glycosyltransferase family 4 protein n=1 Tax=Halalkalicoccus ordinarius TaxID=3116651 RepID=UPI00300F32E9
MYVGLVVYGDLEPRSGGYRYDRELVEGLRACGDRVDVISLPETGYLRSLGHGLSSRLSRAFDRPFDVLLQDELCHPSLFRANRTDRGYPIVSIVHHLRSSEDRSRVDRWLATGLERRYLRSVDAVVCPSRATQLSVSRLASVPGIVAWPGRGRFAPRISATAIREHAHEGPLELLFVGNLVPRKGLDDLVRGLARVDGDWRLTVVGSEGNAGHVARVRTLIDDLDLADRVRFTGWLDDDALAERFERAHLLAVPSSHEGFGIAYLEGMGFGLPPIASADGGAADLVDDGRTGFLVAPNDPAAIGRAVGSVIDDRAFLADLGIAARERYERHPTREETAGRIRAFLETRIGG